MQTPAPVTPPSAPPVQALYRNLPNQLTLLRLVLAGVFFLVLNQYRYPSANPAILWWSMALFILAALTDIADGYLARRWKVESTFGRIMDPFCDKILIIGALIYLSGPRFVDPVAVERGTFFNMISGVYPWMVVVILARELLVTGIRGELESRGIQFGAKLSGKLKTLLQAIATPTVLAIVALDPHARGHHWMIWVRDIAVYATVGVTVISGLPYIRGSMKQLKGTVGN